MLEPRGLQRPKPILYFTDEKTESQTGTRPSQAEAPGKLPEVILSPVKATWVLPHTGFLESALPCYLEVGWRQTRQWVPAPPPLGGAALQLR